MKRLELILFTILALIVIAVVWIAKPDWSMLRFYNQNAYAYTIIKRDGLIIGGTCAGTPNISKIDGILVPPAPPFFGDALSHNFGTVAGSYSFTYTNYGATTGTGIAITCDTGIGTWYTGAVNATTLAPCAVGTATITYTTAGQTTTESGKCYITGNW